ncbi:MAG: MFS transporter [Candidatus Dormibacteria bacterium]
MGIQPGTRRRGILREARFLVFAASQGVSAAGDGIYLVALAWTALSLTHSPVYLGLLMTTTALPRAILLLGGGVLVDRWGPRRVILGSDLSRALLIGGLAGLMLLGHGSIAALFVIAGVFGVFDALFYPATMTIIPSLVRAEHLPSANGVWQMAVQGTIVIGPPLGGVLVGVAGPGPAFAADGASFLVAFFALWAIRAGARPKSSTSGTGSESLKSQLGEGIRATLANPFLRAFIPVAAVINFAAGGPLNVGLPVLARSQGWGAGGFGSLLGGLGLGILLGGLAMGAGLRLPRIGVSVLVLVCVQAGFMALLAMAHLLVVAALLCATMGLLISVVNISITSLIQAVSPPHLLGRVSSVLMFASMSLTPAGYAVSGWVAHVVGPGGLFLAGAALELVAALVALSSPAIRARAPG